MMNITNPIGWLKASGSPFEIGLAMGQQGQDAVHQHLVRSQIWAELTSEAHKSKVALMLQNTQTRFPAIYKELRGLAKGLALPLSDVAAWNCRGDLLASVPDGCTTVQNPGPEIRISHNEDGLPFFRGHCYVLDAQPTQSAGFRGFCYPGSLAGHTFGWNDAGLVHAVNNLRLTKVEPTVPRMVLGRAVLGSASLNDAVHVLSHDPTCGGFHMSLAQAGQSQLFSVEYGRGTASVVEITTRNIHANHALHLDQQGQLITQSSKDRQATGQRLVEDPETSDLDILRDISGPGLPIRRDDPRDPDDENTLATVTFAISTTGIDWAIYGEKDGAASYQGKALIA